MKNFAVRRFATLLMTFIVATLFATIFATSKLAINDKSLSRQKIKNTTQNPASVISGSVNPGAISDHAAQELFLRSLIVGPDEGESGKRRVRAFAKETGLSGADIDVLLIMAQNFVAQLEVLDKQVKVIKDQQWPHPSEATMGQLHILQSHKLQIIANTFGSLETRLGSGVSANKVRGYITNQVKKQVNSFTPPHPVRHQRQGKIRENDQRLLKSSAVKVNSFVAVNKPKPVQIMSEGYTYTNTSSDLSALESYNYGATVEDYSSFGHEYRVTVTAWFGSSNKGSSTYPAAPDYSSPPINVSRTVSLNQGGGSYFDGFLNSSTTGVGFCPVSSINFSTSGSNDGETLEPYVQLSGFNTVTPVDIANTSGIYSDETTATVSYTASVNATGTFDITPGAAITQGPLVLSNLTTTPLGTGSVTVGSGTFTIKYKVNTNTSGKFKPSVRATRPSTGLQLLDPTLITSSVEVQVHNN